MYILCSKTDFFCFGTTDECRLSVDLSGFVQSDHEERTYPDFWLYQVCASGWKLSNSEHLSDLHVLYSLIRVRLNLFSQFAVFDDYCRVSKRFIFLIHIAGSQYLESQFYGSYFYCFNSKCFLIFLSTSSLL